MNSKYTYSTYIKKMGYDDSETERFILEVQKRECIWNTYSKSYNTKCVPNREIKKRAWEEIGRIFNADWDLLRSEERQKKVESLARKWANIRKYYTDELRRKTDSPPKKRHRWYHHLLTFLDDSINKKRVQRIQEFKDIGREKDENSDSESGELFIVEDETELRKMSQVYDNSSPGFIVKPEFADPYIGSEGNVQLWDNSVNLSKPDIENKFVKTEMAGKNPEIMKLLNDNQGSPPINPNPNSICHALANPAPNFLPAQNKTSSLDQSVEASKTFLLSLLPEIMSLNVKQNMQFRLGIMDLLKDIKLRVNNNINTN